MYERQPFLPFCVISSLFLHSLPLLCDYISVGSFHKNLDIKFSNQQGAAIDARGLQQQFLSNVIKELQLEDVFEGPPDMITNVRALLLNVCWSCFYLKFWSLSSSKLGYSFPTRPNTLSIVINFSVFGTKVKCRDFDLWSIAFVMFLRLMRLILT